MIQVLFIFLSMLNSSFVFRTTLINAYIDCVNVWLLNQLSMYYATITSCCYQSWAFPNIFSISLYFYKKENNGESFLWMLLSLVIVMIPLLWISNKLKTISSMTRLVTMNILGLLFESLEKMGREDFEKKRTMNWNQLIDLGGKYLFKKNSLI